MHVCLQIAISFVLLIPWYRQQHIYNLQTVFIIIIIIIIIIMKTSAL